ncbi:hypothetical protein [Deinococcus saxicola]|uniref:hypothetical protein n=1 Tax=Deinococcus saxicola TaxID=249406 RepID=UPI0039EF689C
MGDPPSAKNQDRPTVQKKSGFASRSFRAPTLLVSSFLLKTWIEIWARMPMRRRFLNIRLYRLLLAITALIALILVLVATSTTDRGVEVWTGQSALVVAVSGFYLLLQKLK